MALSNPTLGTAVTSQASTGITSLATGSLSPASNCFLFISGCVDGDITNSLSSVSTTLSNVGSWTIHQRRLASPADGTTIFFAYALVTGAPGSGTVTANFAGTAGDAAVVIPGWLTGHDTTTPVPQSIVSATNTTATASATLGSTPATTSEVLGIIARQTGVNAAATITPGAGFTEAGQQFIWNTTWSFGLESEVQYQNAASPPAAVSATALGTTTGWGAIAVEVAVAAPTYHTAKNVLRPGMFKPGNAR